MLHFMMYNIGANCEKYCLILYENEDKKENFCNRRSSFAGFGNCCGDLFVHSKYRATRFKLDRDKRFRGETAAVKGNAADLYVREFA